MYGHSEPFVYVVARKDPELRKWSLIITLC